MPATQWSTLMRAHWPNTTRNSHQTSDRTSDITTLVARRGKLIMQFTGKAHTCIHSFNCKEMLALSVVKPITSITPVKVFINIFYTCARKLPDNDIAHTCTLV